MRLPGASAQGLVQGVLEGVGESVDREKSQRRGHHSRVSSTTPSEWLRVRATGRVA